MKNIRVNFATGDVQFEQTGARTEEFLEKGIENLGYTIQGKNNTPLAAEETNRFSPQLIRFLLCLPPTLLLLFSH